MNERTRTRFGYSVTCAVINAELWDHNRSFLSYRSDNRCNRSSSRTLNRICAVRNCLLRLLKVTERSDDTPLTLSKNCVLECIPMVGSDADNAVLLAFLMLCPCMGLHFGLWLRTQSPTAVSFYTCIIILVFGISIRVILYVSPDFIVKLLNICTGLHLKRRHSTSEAIGRIDCYFLSAIRFLLALA